MYFKEDCYGLICDNCQETYQDGHSGYSMFVDENQAHEFADNSEWHLLDKHYCPDCFTIDDEDVLHVNADRTKPRKGEVVKEETEQISNWIYDFIQKLPEACRDGVMNSANECFPIHVMHAGRKDVERDTFVQRMNFIQGVLAAYEKNLLSASKEQPGKETAEQVFDRHCLKFLNSETGRSYENIDEIKSTPEYLVTLAAMEEYANQFKGMSSKGVQTANDIWDAAINHISFPFNESFPDKETYLKQFPAPQVDDKLKELMQIIKDKVVSIDGDLTNRGFDTRQSLNYVLSKATELLNKP